MGRHREQILSKRDSARQAEFTEILVDLAPQAQMGKVVVDGFTTAACEIKTSSSSPVPPPNTPATHPFPRQFLLKFQRSVSRAESR